MEKSQELYEELQKLESSRDAIERRWLAANNDPGLLSLVTELNIREKTGPEEEKERLRIELSKRLQERDAEKDSFLIKWKSLRKELDLLTRDTIIRCVTEFAELSGSLGKKKISEIIEKSWDRFRGIAMLKIRSNNPAMGEAREKISKGVETIQKMHACSIPMIEKKAGELTEEIKQIDLSKTVEKTLSEDEFYRFQTPQGIGKDYSGPRSELKTF
jgi:hypothetical protein